MDRANRCYIATIGALYSMSGKEIAGHLRESQGSPSEAEYRSWENSIPVLVTVLHQAGLDALTLVLEYQTLLAAGSTPCSWEKEKQRESRWYWS